MYGIDSMEEDQCLLTANSAAPADRSTLPAFMAHCKTLQLIFQKEFLGQYPFRFLSFLLSEAPQWCGGKKKPCLTCDGQDLQTHEEKWVKSQRPDLRDRVKQEETQKTGAWPEAAV